MAFNNGDATSRVSSIAGEAVSAAASELDLYDELLAFVEMSPEHQSLESDRSRRAAGDPAPEGAPLAPTAAEVTAQHAEADPGRPDSELVFFYEQPEAFDPHSLASDAPVEAAFVYEQAQESDNSNSATLESEAAVVIDFETSAQDDGSSVTDGQRGPRLNTGDLLASLNVSPMSPFTGALSKGVCLACGEIAGADDLFCVSCGIFIDEIASTFPPDPSCSECTFAVVADEVFCPACGSTLTGL